jgi:hypothetical protein
VSSADIHLVCLAYQPPDINTFLSEQTCHQLFSQNKSALANQAPAKPTSQLE